MNMLEKYRSRMLLLLAAMILVSCSDDDIVPRGEFKNPDVIGFSLSPNNIQVDTLTASRSAERGGRYFCGVIPMKAQAGGEKLYLHTSVSDDITAKPAATASSNSRSKSRGVPVTSTGNTANDEGNFESIHGAFGVTAIAQGTTTYFQNEIVTKGGSYWLTSNTYLWPIGEVQFYAYAPYYIDYALNGADAEEKFSELIDGITNTDEARELSFNYTTPKSEDGTEDAKAQPDLMLAYNSTEKTADGSVPMHFRHALAAIRFQTKDVVTGTIKSISVGGVYGQGSCVFDGAAALAGDKVVDENSAMPECFTWTTTGRVTEYTQAINVENTQGTSQDVTANAGEATTFMMIPQQLTDEAYIIVEIETPEGTLVKFSGLIGTDGATWEAGKTYTYIISASEILWQYVFEVTSLSNPERPYDTQEYLALFDHLGTRTLNYTVTSYRYLASDPTKTEILPWQIRNLYDVGYDVLDETTGQMGSVDSTAVNDEPEWILMEPYNTMSDVGSTTAKSYQIDVTPMKIWTSYRADAIMQNNPLKGSDDDPWDVSTRTHNGEVRARSTANCYIVHSGGTYMIPLVYGNAIEAGEVNSKAYTYQYEGNDSLPKNVVGNVDLVAARGTGTSTNSRRYNFQNYECPSGWNGSAYPANDASYGITQPYISTLDGGNCTVADACMVWQDAYNAVKEGSVELYEKPGAAGGSPNDVKHFLKFTLNSEYMQQGNILLAVRDAAGEIVWSWHIWISDYDYTGTDDNFIGAAYGIKPWYELQDVKDVKNSDGIREATDTGSGIVYKMAMSNLGHCVAKTKALIHRKLIMDFVQFEPSGAVINTEHRAVFQRGMEFAGTVGNNTYYQWGRKDPIVGIKNLNDGVKDHWASKDEYKYRVEAKRVFLYESIRTPNVFYANGDNAYVDSTKTGDKYYSDWVRCPGVSYYNLWNNKDLWHKNSNNYYNNDVIKTVYDPSPVGFVIPPASAFRVITSDGHEGNSLKYNYIAGTGDSCVFNGLWMGQVPGDDTGRRYGLYEKIGGGGDIMNIETTGQRAYKSSLAKNGLGGNWNYNFIYLWLADPVMNSAIETNFVNAGAGLSLAIGPDNNMYQGRFFHSYMPAVKSMARPVRPMRDPHYSGEY